MLQLINKSNRKAPVWLVDSRYTIGSSDSCAVLASGKGINLEHATIEVDGEQVSVRNLMGDERVFINSRPVRQSANLYHGDELVVGDTLLLICDPKASKGQGLSPDTENCWTLVAKSSALKGRSFPIRAEAILGRAKECDICLTVSRLSRRHARLSLKNGQFFVEDLMSSNGTFVNGKRITSAELQSGDELHFDSLAFLVFAPIKKEL